MEDLKIRQKCEDMIQYGYIALKQFPKAEKIYACGRNKEHNVETVEIHSDLQ